MKKELNGEEALEMLYDLGLIDINGGRRLTERKEKLFKEIWNNYEIGYPLISRKLNIGHNSVKNYASDIFKIIGNLLGEKIDQSTLRSSVTSFLTKPSSIDQFKGSLVGRKSIVDTLKPAIKELIKNYSCDPNITEENLADNIITLIKDNE